ncbi:MAG: RNA recognition motif domain-containing protein [Chthoniobacterales bacterium]
MGNRLYVANLPYQTTESDLERHFQQCGTVSSVQIVMDRETNRSRGFGFITMGTDDEARAAIEQLNGQELDSRQLRVSEARPREERPPQKKFGGGGGGDYRGGGGGGRPDRGNRGGGDRGDRGSRGGYEREDREGGY